TTPPTHSSSLRYPAAHHNLQSFPTRRSSDLQWIDKQPWTDKQWKDYAAAPELRTFAAYYDGELAGYYELRHESEPDPSSPRLRRSEELTSELQSRFDLVCRLLLEKKKKRHKT